MLSRALQQCRRLYTSVLCLYLRFLQAEARKDANALESSMGMALQVSPAYRQYLLNQLALTRSHISRLEARIRALKGQA
ncbi:MAG: hypothetical protein EPO09_00095 [Aquabacterium sp.]|uniref:hypothetical protein n=1 Tax=Aquabacterium sp. TaxID=1872578 RepID=UPI0012060062|nr:hypothetical protein [Aquabacterium sp.]TAL00153.1 MAG: hypothetical protein EPO09_00095 [Aquabacterium sp.]